MGEFVVASGLDVPLVDVDGGVSEDDMTGSSTEGAIVYITI